MFTCSRCKRDISEGLFCPFCGAPAPQANGEPADPWIGQTVADKYFVHQLLGRGGMGQVYKATHLTLDRPVVLKMLNRSLSADPSIVQRFHREARAASRLNHPNSINVMDFGQAADGTLYMVMEYLPGRSLARVISEDFPVDPARVVKIGAQILAALAEAHAVGILHRDLKPENVMVEARRDEPDFVKVLDFGIAQLNETGTAGGPRLTQAGMVCGTPGYMSPEQARGEPLDARSDLYSVGIILYELLTGLLPFDGETPQALIAKVMVETPMRPGERRPEVQVPAALEALVMSALSSSPDGRPATAEEFRRALLACALTESRPRRSTPPPATLVLQAGAGAGAVPRAAAGAVRPRSIPPTLLPSQPLPGTRPPPSRATPAHKALTPRPARRALTPEPAARDDDDDDEETEAPPPPPPPKGSKVPLIVGSLAALAVLGGVAAFAVLGTRVSPPPAPVRTAHPEPRPEPKAAEAERVAQPPKAVEPDRNAPPPEPQARSATPRRQVRPKKHTPVLETGEALNSLAVPAQSSGEGIVTVDATPWASITIDGYEVGETPREVRVRAGTYRLRASHPQLGSEEKTLKVVAGERVRWQVGLAR